MTKKWTEHFHNRQQRLASQNSNIYSLFWDANGPVGRLTDTHIPELILMLCAVLQLVGYLQMKCYQEHKEQRPSGSLGRETSESISFASEHWEIMVTLEKQTIGPWTWHQFANTPSSPAPNARFMVPVSPQEQQREMQPGVSPSSYLLGWFHQN